MPIPYKDMHLVPEDNRIAEIVKQVKLTKGRIAVLVDTEEIKIKRYMDKIKKAYPEAIVVRKGELTKGSTLISVSHPDLEHRNN